jgi:hypothetical protein
VDRRALFETDPEEQNIVKRFTLSLNNYLGQRRRTGIDRHPPTRLSRENAYRLRANALFFRDSIPYSDPVCHDTFPNQYISIHDLLYDRDSKRNPLVRPCAENEIRYFHIPANNMDWAEV